MIPASRLRRSIAVPRPAPPLLAIVLCAACGDGGEPPSLGPVVGVWRTTEPRYADRHFEIERDGGLRIGRGPEGVEACEVLAVELRADEHGRRYDLQYLGDGGHPSRFSIVYDAQRDVAFFPGQRHMLWRRTDG